MTPQEYCQQKAAQSGSSFYYSFLFLPRDRREAIIALYAFCREVDDVVDECADGSIAAAKLNWWRSEIDNLFAGTPQHPVTQALAPVVERFGLPREHFLEVIDGMQMDLDYNSYPDFKTLSLYCHRVASMVGLMSIEIFGYEDRQTRKYAHDLGMAFQLTNIVRDVREDATRGRVYIPLDELSAHGVSVQDVLALKPSPGFTELMKVQGRRAREYYDRAFEHLPEVDRYNQRSGVIMAEIYRTVLDELERDGYQVFRHRIALTPVRKLWIAWRTLRREKKRAQRQAALRRSTAH